MPWGSTRGPKWHGKGWRDRDTGELYVNLKHSWDLAQFQCERGIGEQHSISQILGDIQFDVYREHIILGEGMRFEFYLQEKALEPSDKRIDSLFNGGETIYVKVFDEDNQEMFMGNGWEVKYRGYSKAARGG